MEILLVRHGESEANVDLGLYRRQADHTIGLSARGVAQAQDVGRQLAAFCDDVPGLWRVWHSPYVRARQTAEEIVSALDWQVDSVREHILLGEQQMGLFDGLDDEYALRYPDEAEHYDRYQRFDGRFWARPPLGESRFDVAQRVHQAFGTFHRDAERHGVERLIVVCHGTTLRAFVMMWCHLGVEWFEHEPNPGNCAVRWISDDVDRGYVLQPSDGGDRRRAGAAPRAGDRLGGPRPAHGASGDVGQEPVDSRRGPMSLMAGGGPSGVPRPAPPVPDRGLCPNGWDGPDGHLGTHLTAWWHRVTGALFRKEHAQ